MHKQSVSDKAFNQWLVMRLIMAISANSKKGVCLISNVALNILNSLTNVKQYSEDYTNVLELIDSDQLEVKHIARGILKAILNGYADGLCNLLTLGVELNRALEVVNPLNDSQAENDRDEILDNAEKVANDDFYKICFKALFNEGEYCLADALQKVVDGEVIQISDADYFDAYQTIGEYYAENFYYDLPDVAKRYFDYEAYGRDLSFEIEWYETEDGIFEVID